MAGLLALTMALSLTACGSKNTSSMATDQMATVAPSAPGVSWDKAESEEMGWNGGYDTPAEVPAGSGSPTADQPLGQKLIRRASLQLETMEFDASAAALQELVARMGGYLEYSDVSNRGNGYRWAEYTIRVPEEHYQAFLDEAGQLCHETWRSTSQEDISEVYYDTAGRLETQKIKLARLQELLGRAENMEDIIALENAISETEERIDSLSGTLQHYDAQVSYSTISVTLSEVYRLSDTEEAPVSFGGRMAAAFRSGWSSFVSGLQSFAVGLAYSWMWLLVLVVVALVVIRWVKKRLRRMKEKKEEQITTDNSQKM